MFCLLVLLLAAIISRSLQVVLYLTSPLPPSFSWYIYMSSLECKALCVIINFLVLWCFSLSSSIVHFKNSSEYLTSGTALVFPSLMRFLPQSLVLKSVLFSYFFSIIFACLIGVRFQYFHVLVIFLFSKTSDSFLFWQFYSFCYSSFSTFHYQDGTFSLPNSIPISWHYILIVCT